MGRGIAAGREGHVRREFGSASPRLMGRGIVAGREGHVRRELGFASPRLMGFLGWFRSY